MFESKTTLLTTMAAGPACHNAVLRVLMRLLQIVICDILS